VTCRTPTASALQSLLLGAAALGVRNILCLTGDHVVHGDQPDAKPVFDIDSIALLRLAGTLKAGRYLSGRPITPAPDLFLARPRTRSRRPGTIRPLRLRRRSRRARFIQTQIIFNVPRFREFMTRARDLGLDRQVPILAGVAPIRTARAARYMRDRIPGMDVPDALVHRMEQAGPRPKRRGSGLAPRLSRSCGHPGSRFPPDADTLGGAVAEIARRSGLRPARAGGRPPERRCSRTGARRRRRTLRMKTVPVVRNQDRRDQSRRPVRHHRRAHQPHGRKKLAEEMRRFDMTRVREDARAQVDAGATMLDINAGIPGADEPAMLKAAVLAVMKPPTPRSRFDSSTRRPWRPPCPPTRQGAGELVTGEDHSLERLLPLVARRGGHRHRQRRQRHQQRPRGAPRWWRARSCSAPDHGIPAEDVNHRSAVHAESGPTTSSAASRSRPCVSYAGSWGSTCRSGRQRRLRLPDRPPLTASFILTGHGERSDRGHHQLPRGRDHPFRAGRDLMLGATRSAAAGWPTIRKAQKAAAAAAAALEGLTAGADA